MALSQVTVTETCSSIEYAEELSTVFRQNPGLLIPHKDHSMGLVVRNNEVPACGLLYRLFKQQSAPVRYISSATLQEIGHSSLLEKHRLCTSPTKRDALASASKQNVSYLVTPQRLITWICANSLRPQLLMRSTKGVT